MIIQLLTTQIQETTSSLIQYTLFNTCILVILVLLNNILIIDLLFSFLSFGIQLKHITFQMYVLNNILKFSSKFQSLVLWLFFVYINDCLNIYSYIKLFVSQQKPNEVKIQNMFPAKIDKLTLALTKPSYKSLVTLTAWGYFCFTSAIAC